MSEQKKRCVCLIKFLQYLLAAPFWLILSRTSPQKNPVPCWKYHLHRLATKISVPNPRKGQVQCHFDTRYYYDANKAQYFISKGCITTKSIRIPVKNYVLIWGVNYSDQVLRQDELSNLDLIWVLTMDSCRKQKSILFFHEPEDSGPKILDGAHRLVRAFVDGDEFINVEVIEEKDVYLFKNEY